ncbi:hypothetical protein HPB50_010200 [Hyalomma asiaticum]|uniref:Uncharacterized protein n=1 Tax=Hyalomma asiaticum TaxID=266040 RepID=A0ACB7SSZ8_HYAAI|nr:hypothetical protein HPB50_010200 [Hyalomma asiaticum]
MLYHGSDGSHPIPAVWYDETPWICLLQRLRSNLGLRALAPHQSGVLPHGVGWLLQIYHLNSVSDINGFQGVQGLLRTLPYSMVKEPSFIEICTVQFQSTSFRRGRPFHERSFRFVRSQKKMN